MTRITRHTVAVPPQSQPLAVLESTPDFVGTLRETLAGRYGIEREIGRGGMALVYLARDLKHNRSVAMKVLRPEFSATLMAQRFFDEIRHTSRLQHPGILPIHESDKAGDLFFYTMPYIPGNTLRKQLLRERQLSIPEVVRLTREIADALTYAHAQGIIHRDIKPENILLSHGHPILADFGIARAVNEAGGERLTSSGLVIGTPEYMSPEQCSKGGAADGRADVYSLGCVVYEMLAGEPPFTGHNAQAVISRQMQEAPRSLRVIRGTVPEHMEAAINVALAKVPADRFTGAVQFAEAMAGDTRQMPVGWQVGRWRKELIAAGAIAAVALGVWSWPYVGIRSGAPRVPMDTTRFAIMPFDYDVGVSRSVNEVQRLHDALRRWDGITLADPSQVAEVLPRAVGPVSPTEATRGAIILRTGRFFRGAISRADGDSLRVQVWLYNTQERSVLGEEVVKLASDLRGADSAFAHIADRLLLRDALPDTVLALSGTRSLPARQAFLQGQRALVDWDLERADSAFTAAAGLDDQYAEAHLWVALSRAWRGQEPPRWGVAAERALAAGDALSGRNRVIATAIIGQARGGEIKACESWRTVSRSMPRDYLGWYGYAYCQSTDSLVVADPASPSGWRFRSSYQEALRAYRRAFEVNPSVLTSFRRNAYGSLRVLFKISGNAWMTAPPAAPNTSGFVAFPSWQGDSVAFVPYPRDRLRSLRLTSQGQEAVRRLRMQFRDVALAWASALPRSPEALEAVSISLSLLGDVSAIDTLQRARRLMTDPGEQFRLASSEVWMRLVFAIPSDTAGLLRARRLADSLLSGRTPDGNPLAALSLASLTGRAKLAAELSRRDGVGVSFGVPGPLGSTALPLLVYSALGGPVDSLSSLETQVRRAIAGSVVPEARTSALRGFFLRPATLAFASYRFNEMTALNGQGNPLLDLQVAWAMGNDSLVRSGWQTIRNARRDAMPWNITVDALRPEAELLLAMGDLQAAADWLNPTLDVLPQVSPHSFDDPVRAASLVRAMALRARIAGLLGRPDEAHVWAEAVLILWSDADAFLQATKDDLRRLTALARTRRP